MKLEDVLESAFLVKPDDTLSHITSQMAEGKKYEAFVFDGELKGIVTLDDMIKRRVSEPQKMKIAYFMKPVTMFSVETPVEDIMNYMLVSEFRSVPVERDGKIYAITKPKLLSFVKKEVFAGKKAKDIMQTPYCASINDTLLTITSVMRDTGVNRIPIIDGKGKFAGLADSMSLAKMLTDRERSSFGEKVGEKARIGDITISRFLNAAVMRVDPEEVMEQVVKKISREETCTAIVEDDGKFMGIITIKDIFKMIGKSLETVYIRVSGLHDEDEFVRKKIDEMIEKAVQKALKVVKLSYVVIHVSVHKKKENRNERMKYSVQGRFVTDKGNFYASDHEWEPIKAMKFFLQKIEGEIYKQIDKNRGY